MSIWYAHIPNKARTTQPKTLVFEKWKINLGQRRKENDVFNKKIKINFGVYGEKKEKKWAHNKSTGREWKGDGNISMAYATFMFRLLGNFMFTRNWVTESLDILPRILVWEIESWRVCAAIRPLFFLFLHFTRRQLEIKCMSYVRKVLCNTKATHTYTHTRARQNIWHRNWDNKFQRKRCFLCFYSRRQYFITSDTHSTRITTNNNSRRKLFSQRAKSKYGQNKAKNKENRKENNSKVMHVKEWTRSSSSTFRRRSGKHQPNIRFWSGFY